MARDLAARQRVSGLTSRSAAMRTCATSGRTRPPTGTSSSTSTISTRRCPVRGSGTSSGSRRASCSRAARRALGRPRAREAVAALVGVLAGDALAVGAHARARGRAHRTSGGCSRAPRCTSSSRRPSGPRRRTRSRSSRWARRAAGGSRRGLRSSPGTVDGSEARARALARYRETLSDDRQLVFDAYRPVDVAFKVVGTGSVGTRDYAVLCFGAAPDDPLVLQVKEEPASAWAPVLPRAPRPQQEGRRVAQGQHRMQTAIGPLPRLDDARGPRLPRAAARGPQGWPRAGRPRRARAPRVRARLRGGVRRRRTRGPATRVRSRATPGSPAASTPRCVAFALAYADQTEQDHEGLVKAIRAGRFHARRA